MHMLLHAHLARQKVDMIKGMKEECCSRGSVEVTAMEQARQGTRRGTDLGNDHPKCFINHNLGISKYFLMFVVLQIYKSLIFTNCFPYYLLLTFAVFNRSLELKETDACFRDEVAI